MCGSNFYESDVRYYITKYCFNIFSELLKTQGKECLITWLQQTLLDACCVKINGKDMFKSDGKSLEPVLYHFNGKFFFNFIETRLILPGYFIIKL